MVGCFPLISLGVTQLIGAEVVCCERKQMPKKGRATYVRLAMTLSCLENPSVLPKSRPNIMISTSSKTRTSTVICSGDLHIVVISGVEKICIVKTSQPAK